MKLQDLPDEFAPAIASVELVTKSVGHGDVEHIAKFRLWDKSAAIALLFKVRGATPRSTTNLNVQGRLMVTHAQTFEAEAQRCRSRCSRR